MYFILLFTLFSATCGLISAKDEKAIVGFSTSQIQIWPLGSSLLPCSKFDGNASRITLGCDNIPDNVTNPHDEGPLYVL